MAIPKVVSGITGLDTMLGGGLPQGRVILVTGGPGTGKSVMCSQFLNYGLANGEKAVYVSLDETKPHYVNEMKIFGWDFEKHESDGRFAFVDAASVRRIPDEARVGRLPVGGKELGLVNLIDLIGSTVEKVGASRVVLDSISGLVFRFPKVEERRMAILDIIEALGSTGATYLVTSEAPSAGEGSKMQPEEYLAQGVIILQTLRNGDRAIQVVKMRGSQIDTHPRPYMINATGFEVYPNESVFQTA